MKVGVVNVVKFFVFLILALAEITHAAGTDNCSLSNDSIATWDLNCFDRNGNDLQVKKEYLKKIRGEKKFPIIIHITDPFEGVVVNREGIVITRGIYYSTQENFTHGFIRYRQKASGKCGYVSTKTLKITIPAQWDECGQFYHGSATVCNDCKNYCSDIDCHTSSYFGGQSFVVDKRGKIIRAFANKTIENFCPKDNILNNNLGKNPPFISCDLDLRVPLGQ